MPETRVEEIVRDALHSRANGAQVPQESSTDVVVRARRRALRNATGLAAVVALATILGLHVLPVRAHSAPATPPTPAVLRGDGRIAFTRTFPSVERGLFVIGHDGGSEIHISPQGCSDDTCRIDKVAWSPGRDGLMFSDYSEKTLGTTFGPIYATGPDGSGLRAVTHCHPPECADDSPAWSPDGSRVAFVRRSLTAPYRSTLYVVNSDGSNLTRLSRSDVSLVSPAWSPDGSRIAYVEIYGTDRSRIVVTKTDGSGSSILIDGAARDNLSSPAWSPDGSDLAYRRSPRSGSGPSQIWVSGADDGASGLVLSARLLGSPLWSPDGSRLAVVVDGSLLVMNPDGTARVRLTDPGVSADPAWSPSGSQLACFLHHQLVVVSADGSGQRALARVDGQGMIAWQPVAG